MNAKRTILLGGFLFSLGLLSGQQLQRGLSIGGPVMGYFTPMDLYYNSIGSAGLLDDVFQLAPTLSFTYTFAPKRRKQWYIKQSGFIQGYQGAQKSWDYQEYIIRLGGGQMYYLPFAPSFQWQWEIGGQVDRVWNYRYRNSDVEYYAKWRAPLPYIGINLQTTAIGKHLILGVGIEAAPYLEAESFVEAVRAQTILAWSIQARDQNPVYERPKLDDTQKKIHLLYQQARYGSGDYFEEDYLTDMRSIVGEYWWMQKRGWRFASRIGLGFSTTGKGADIGLDYDWLIHIEQNAYLRMGEHFSLLPFGGVGVLTGQVWQEYFELNRRINHRKNLFRPYLKGGFRIQAPHHRVFVEFSANTVPSFQAGLGVRLGRTTEP